MKAAQIADSNPSTSENVTSPCTSDADVGVDVNTYNIGLSKTFLFNFNDNTVEA